VVAITGTLRPRKDPNPKLATGGVELLATRVQVRGRPLPSMQGRRQRRRLGEAASALTAVRGELLQAAVPALNNSNSLTEPNPPARRSPPCAQVLNGVGRLLPFPISETEEGDAPREELRLKHRVLDLRWGRLAAGQGRRLARVFLPQPGRTRSCQSPCLLRAPLPSHRLLAPARLRAAARVHPNPT
jgi:hypothetical protein